MGNCFSQGDSLIVYKNPKIPIEERIEDLLIRMTLEEKVDMLGGTGFESKLNERLGIPSLNMVDGPVGVRWGENATAFPAGIAMAASWDTELVERIGKALAQETKAKGRNVLLGPCVNIQRVPHAGRNFESFSEDPYLTSRIAVSYVKGVQSEKVIATTKHFACNNQEYERRSIDVRVDERTMREIYLPAFKAAVQEAKCWAIMSAYNRLNGHYCSSNTILLTDILKNEWGFQGVVVSDWEAVHSTIPTLFAGLDIEMPKAKYLMKKDVLEAVKSGTVKESKINDKIRRMLRAMFAMGLLDQPVIPSLSVTGGKKPDHSSIDTPEHRKLVLEASQESIVLLKNERNVLPLDPKKIKSIAVIGPNAAISRTGGGGSSMVPPFYSIGPLKALKNKIGKDIKIYYSPGMFMEEKMPPIESAYLLPPQGEKENQGLLGEYFNNMKFEGEPIIRKIDRQINFQGGNNFPKDIPVDYFSVRWTGKLVPPKSAKYILSISSDDGSRLYLGGELLLDNWGSHALQTKSATVELKKGKPVDIKVEFYEEAGETAVILGWDIVLDDVNPATETEAAKIAKESDVAIVFVGLSDHLESEGGDRSDLLLPRDQESLIKAIVKANKNTIVVLNNGAPVLMNNWINQIPALLEVWYPGQEGGNAIVDVLFGQVNPSGKLPITFPNKWEDSPAYDNYPGEDGIVHYKEGIFVGYRHFDKENIEPLFPFGYGLSYTKFSYSDIKITPRKVNKGENVDVSFNLKNSGLREGAEVVQLYLQDIESIVERPSKELKGFQKVYLKPGEEKRISLTIKSSDMKFFDIGRKDWVAEAGKFKVMLGSSSRDIRIEGEFELK